MKHLSLPIVVEADTDGYFVSCPALQGCYSQGDSYAQAGENIKDAIRLHVEDRLANGEARKGATPTTTIRLDPVDIARAKVQAKRKGLRYQTYLKMLLREALLKQA